MHFICTAVRLNTPKYLQKLNDTDNHPVVTSASSNNTPTSTTNPPRNRASRLSSLRPHPSHPPFPPRALPHSTISSLKLTFSPLCGSTTQELTTISLSAVTSAPRIVGFSSVPCRRVQYPTLEPQPTIAFLIIALSLTITLSRMIQSRRRTPGPISALGPIAALGPMRASGETLAVGWTKAEPTSVNFALFAEDRMKLSVDATFCRSCAPLLFPAFFAASAASRYMAESARACAGVLTWHQKLSVRIV
mmetsp:Transcript_2746/g.7267  ORF Transcript_2746/g.7267 Transcript_2746/m.7267 type:complete len:248 (+) Transcript_2746:54-797(+)